MTPRKTRKPGVSFFMTHSHRQARWLTFMKAQSREGLVLAGCLFCDVSIFQAEQKTSCRNVIRGRAEQPGNSNMLAQYFFAKLSLSLGYLMGSEPFQNNNITLFYQTMVHPSMIAYP